MAKNYTYPHVEINVDDRSIYTPLVREQLGLFRPIFFMRTQKGVSGVPVWYSTYTEAVAGVGEGTFDYLTPYYSREALFLERVFARQGAFIVRMSDENTADYGSLVLELTVKKVRVPQYETDEDGQFVYEVDDEGNVVTDESGNPKRVPVVDGSGAEVVEEGYSLKWSVRPMKLLGPSSRVGSATVGDATVTDKPETLANLKPVTYGTGDNAYTVYPILAVKATSVGAYANDVGVKLFTDIDNMNVTLAKAIGSLPYTFGVVQKTYGQDTVSAVRSINDYNTEYFVAKPNATDTTTARNVSFDDIVNGQYENLPFDIRLYSENIEAIGRLILEVEDNETLTDPYLVNLAEPYDYNNVPYRHVVMSDDEDAVNLNESRILYLQGGSDGDITDATIEKLTRQYLKDLVYKDILDQPRYPFTHIVDTGVTLPTKATFIEFIGKHDGFKVILSTQDCTKEVWNTLAEDYSTGSYLFGRCALQPESVIKGTECCRAEIYMQSGYLATGNYRGFLPATLDILMKKSLIASTGRLTGLIGGLPTSEISLFKTWNWTPTDADVKQRSWDSGLNYFQYYDMTSVHWPALRSVYRYDTSVLSSANFTDAVVYAKHIVRYNWSRFTGREEDFDIIASEATEALSTDLRYMLNGKYDVEVEFTQSEEEAKIGYIAHAIVKLTGKPQQRVWVVDIVCYRSGYNSEE